MNLRALLSVALTLALAVATPAAADIMTNTPLPNTSGGTPPPPPPPPDPDPGPPADDAAYVSVLGTGSKAADAAPSTITSADIAVTVSSVTDAAITMCGSLRDNSLGTTYQSVKLGTVDFELIYRRDSGISAAADLECWVLLDPPVGAGTVHLVWQDPVNGNGVQSYAAAVIEFQHVNSVKSFNHAIDQTGTSKNPTVDVTTTDDGSMVVGAVRGTGPAAAPFTPGGGATERVDIDTGDNPFNDSGLNLFTKAVASSGLTTMASTMTTPGNWVAGAMELSPETSGGVTPPEPPPTPVACTTTLPAGSDRAALQAAINARADGDKVCAQAGATIQATAGVVMDCTTKGGTLDFNGSTLAMAANVEPLSLTASWEWIRNISAIGVSGGDQTVTISSTAGAVADDWIKIVAENGIKGWSSTGSHRLGEAMQIRTVTDGSHLLLKGLLWDSALYATSIRGALYQSKPCTVQNGAIIGNQAQATWTKSLMGVSGVVDANINHMRFWNSLDKGIQNINTVNLTLQEADFRNLPGGATYYGYAFETDASRGTTWQGGYVDNTRDAADSNSIAITALHDPNYYGVSFEETVEDVYFRDYTNSAPNNGDTGYDWHTGTQFSTYNRLLGEGTDNANFLTARGRLNTLTNSMGYNFPKVVQIFDEYNVSAFAGCGDLIDHNVFREVLTSGVYCAGTTCTATEQPTSERNVVSNNHIEMSTGASANSFAACAVDGGGNTFQSNKPGGAESYTGTSGDDIWPAGTGDDTMDMGAGNDTVWPGPGNDTVTLGTGIDRWIYAQPNEGSDTITDFTAGAGGDILWVGFVLHACNYFRSDPIGDGYIRATQSGGNTLVQLDCNGGANSWATIATLTGVNAANLVAGNWNFNLKR